MCEPPEELVNEFVKHPERILILVGTGVTCATDGTPCASWKGLLQDGLNHCLKRRHTMPDKWGSIVQSMINESTTEGLIQAASRIERHLRGIRPGEFHDWLNKSVGEPASRLVGACSHTRLKKGFAVESLQRRNTRTGTWAELLVEDHRTPPFDQAVFRIDFPAWLARRSRRDRRVVASLARGDRTKDVAQQFRLSAARVSQLRREVEHSWLEFHREAVAPVQRTRRPGRQQTVACCG